MTTLATNCNQVQYGPTIIFKAKALSIHLCISTLLLLASWLLIAYVWYPDIHFSINGGWEGMKLMAAVDFVLGPIITLVIFHPKKARKLIILDVCIVAVLQISALIYGLIQIYHESPTAVVFVENEFRIAQKEPLHTLKVDYSIIYQLDEQNTPPLIISFYDKKTKDNSKAMDLFLSTGLLDEYYVHQYQAIKGHLEKVTTTDKTKEFLSKHPMTNSALEMVLAKYKLSSSQARIIPLKGKYEDAFVILDESGKFVSYLRLEEEPKLLPF